MTLQDNSAFRVDVGPPVEVGRAVGHLWFPALHRLDERRILCEATLADDRHQGEWRAALFMSCDGGGSWTRETDIPSYGPGSVLLEPGRMLLQPYELWPLSAGDARNAWANGTLITLDAGGRLRLERAPVRFLGFPRPYQIKGDTVYVVTSGAIVRLNDGRLLCTVYGKFAGDERYSICAVTSEDHGVTWRFQAIVARADVAPDAREGPNEAALARLPSGRLLCVFRVAGRQPFWMTTSADEGASWAAPSPMSGVWSVMPHLVALPSGLVLLSGGREGLFLWVAADGEGREWRRTDLAAHHNACVPESMRFAAGYVGGQATVSPAPSTSYTGLLPIGPDEVLVAYDRLANGWKGAPGPYGEHDMVFCARVRVQRTGP